MNSLSYGPISSSLNTLKQTQTFTPPSGKQQSFAQLVKSKSQNNTLKNSWMQLKTSTKCSGP
jgi:hypothetical protein